MPTRRSVEALPTGPEKARAVREMFDAIAGRYDLVNRIMTFGLDVRWRRRTVAALGLPVGSRVLDVACGTGDLCREVAGSGLSPVGVDSSAGMLAAARTGAPLVHGDALALSVPDGGVDGLVCGFALRNFVDLDAFLAEAARVVRPGGRMALLEVAQPEHSLLRLGHAIYFGRVVPLLGGLLSDRAAYRYLPRSVSYLPTPAELLERVRAAGFGDADRLLLTLGAAQLVVATRDER